MRSHRNATLTNSQIEYTKGISTDGNLSYLVNTDGIKIKSLESETQKVDGLESGGGRRTNTRTTKQFHSTTRPSAPESGSEHGTVRMVSRHAGYRLALQVNDLWGRGVVKRSWRGEGEKEEREEGRPLAHPRSPMPARQPI